VHIVPATVNVRRALLEVSSGDIVWLGGSLIAAHSIGRANEITWRSSLSRTDIGDGACELMFVERVIKRGVEYR
jgi:hypothetical protein